MKRIITIALCLVLLFAMTVPASADGALYLSISASSGTAYRGDTVTFYINASGGGTCESFGVVISYDSSVFEYVGGSASVSGAAIASMDSSGLFASYSPIGAPAGTVGSFSLRVKSGASFGSFGVSASASANGAAASASGASVSVLCNHSYGDWQQYSESYHQKACSICGTTQEESHAWNAGTLISQPSCKEEGSMSFTCTVCAATKTEVLGKTEDHQYGAYQQVDGTTHQAACGICGGVLTEDHTWDAGSVTLAATCKAPGQMLFTCTGCAAIKEEVIPVSENHSYNAWTQVNDSTHQHECSVCNKQEIMDHSWNAGVVTKMPNCIATGTYTYTCVGCGATKVEELPVSGVHTYDHGCDKDCNVCAAIRITNHDFGRDWYKNANGHWHVCKNCGAKSPAQDHVPGAEATEYRAQLCTECDYVLKPELAHEHRFEEEVLSFDEDGHWYACDGCEEQNAFTAHDFDNACDTLCNACGYTRQVVHEIGEEWHADFVNHFQECVVCGKAEQPIRHTPGPNATEFTPQLCEICGYELMPAVGHSFSKEWSSDAQTHFRLCECGEKTEIADHVWDAGFQDEDGTTYTCVVCQQQKSVAKDMTWLIIAAAVLIVLILVLILLIRLIKRRKDDTEEWEEDDYDDTDPEEIQESEAVDTDDVDDFDALGDLNLDDLLEPVQELPVMTGPRDDEDFKITIHID